MGDPHYVPDKDPWIAAGLSLLLPGAGHLYAGDGFYAGVSFCFVAASGIAGAMVRSVARIAHFGYDSINGIASPSARIDDYRDSLPALLAGLSVVLLANAVVALDAWLTARRERRRHRAWLLRQQ